MIAAGTPPVRVWNRPVWLSLAIAAALTGCNSRPPTVTTAASIKTTDPTDELVQSVRDELRTSADQAACRRLVDLINGYLPRLPADRRPAAPTAAEKAVLEKEFSLRPEEGAEVTRAEFTNVDAYYLEETFLFRDVARSLDVGRLPPVERAMAALGWVVRNLRPVAAAGPAVPPGYAAMRGAASPLERTYALHTLLRQLDLDAALIGDAGAGPEGVWAVGVLADGQVHLFDARLGLPLPGPAGAAVLTLAEARSSADPFRGLALDPKLPYDVTADRVKRGEVFVAAPLSSLSPRMRFLQGLVADDTVRLAADPAVLRDRFRDAVGTDGPAVRLWCPPTVDALPRVLYTFVPASDGGGDRSPPGQLRLRQAVFGQVPFGLIPDFLRQLTGEPGNRITLEFADRAMALYQPGHARDLILRGRFREATDKLVALQERAKRRSANPRELETKTQEWADAARAYFAEASRQKSGRGDAAGAARMEESRETMETLWRDVRGPQGFLNHLVADELAAQSTYLLGLSKHEQAERMAHGKEPVATGQAAWASAQRWWTSFLTNYPNRPEESAARRNLARALAAGGHGADAKAAYEALANSNLPPLERLACRYLAASIK